MRPSAIARFLGCDRGDVFLETAISIPVLIILMAGLVDFGLAYSDLSTAQKSLRNATRYLSILPHESFCGSPSWGLNNARRIAVYGRHDIGPSDRPLIDGWSTSDIALDPASCAASPPGVIRLEATVRYRGLVWKVLGISSSIDMKASHQERWIGG